MKKKHEQYTQEMLVSLAISTFMSWFLLAQVKDLLFVGDLFLLGIFVSFFGMLAVWQVMIWLQELKRRIKKRRGGWGTTTATYHMEPGFKELRGYYTTGRKVAQ